MFLWWIIIVGVIVFIILGYIVLHIDELNVEEKEDFPKSLEDLIDFKDFNYARWWEDEDRLLKPQLEALGYTDIRFCAGDMDSFGPLTRMCYATYDDERYEFMYG